MSLTDIRRVARRTINSVGATSQSIKMWLLVTTMIGFETIQDLFMVDSTHPHATSDRGQTDTVITVVIIAVVSIVGILIYSQVDSSIDVTGNLSGSKSNVTDGFGDAMELVPVVMIVLVAALVIGVVQRFRQ